MSSDEAVTKGAGGEDLVAAVDVETSPSVAASHSAAANADAEAGAEDASDESSTTTSAAEHPKRRLRLNPTIDKSQARARPSLTPNSSAPVTAATSEQNRAPSAEPTAQAASDEEPESLDEGKPTGDVQQITVKPREKEKTKETPPPKRDPVEIPRANSASLDAEMEAEIEAALAAGEIGVVQASAPTEDVEEGEETAAPVTEETLEKGMRLTGRIQSFHGEDIFLDLGLRSPGVVPRRQFTSGKPPEVGQLIEVAVDKVDRQEGLILVNLPKGLRKVSSNWESVEVGQIVDCMVVKTNKGGLEVTVSSLRGFLPAGQVDFGFISDLEPYVGQKLRVKIIDVNPKKRNLVVSRRDYLKIERKEAEKTLWTTLQEGQILSGKVKTLKDYGVFVDLGGVDGFLHIGEMSWTRLKHPSEAVAEGQPIEVKVIGLDREKKKISLSAKQLAQNPWSGVADRYPAGKTVTGRVTRVTDFGGFVELEPGLEGLIHISELDYKHVRKVSDVLKVGQSVDAKVLEVDADKKRISLSLKALLEKPPEAKPDEELSPSGGEAYQRKHKGPLRGGTGIPSGGGGGLFGNPKNFK